MKCGQCTRKKSGGGYPYQTIFKCKYNLSFDEGGDGEYGFPSICDAHNVRSIWKRWFTDIYTGTFEFRHKQYKDDTPYYREIESCIFDAGKITVVNADDKSEFESMYIHFQGRDMSADSEQSDKFYMIPNRITSQITGMCKNDESEKSAYLKSCFKKRIKAKKKKVLLLFFFIGSGKFLDRNWMKYVI